VGRLPGALAPGISLLTTMLIFLTMREVWGWSVAACIANLPRAPHILLWYLPYAMFSGVRYRGGGERDDKLRCNLP